MSYRAYAVPQICCRPRCAWSWKKLQKSHFGSHGKLFGKHHDTAQSDQPFHYSLLWIYPCCILTRSWCFKICCAMIWIYSLALPFYALYTAIWRFLSSQHVMSKTSALHPFHKLMCHCPSHRSRNIYNWVFGLYCCIGIQSTRHHKPFCFHSISGGNNLMKHLHHLGWCTGAMISLLSSPSCPIFY